jgi:SAM-dependent methyltransferase
MNPPNSAITWTTGALLALGRGYQAAAVLLAATELDLFTALAAEPLTAIAVAARQACDVRATTLLLDALAALGLMRKDGDRYAVPDSLVEALAGDGPHSLLAITRHQANCLRRWAQLAQVVKTGRPAEGPPSVRGEEDDEASFIEGMHNLAAPQADNVVQGLSPLEFTHVLDVGGATGTWTIAFLRARPAARATLFDRPSVIPRAERRLAAAGLTDRVRCVGGDFLRDPLPLGADLAWVSAIVHQNSRAQNRALFGRVLAALVPGGRIAIRDLVMEPGRTRPPAGALFAINMLVATAGGGTFTLAELREDLESAGFAGVELATQDEGMNSLVVARKPGAAGARAVAGS